MLRKIYTHTKRSIKAIVNVTVFISWTWKCRAIEIQKKVNGIEYSYFSFSPCHLDTLFTIMRFFKRWTVNSRVKPGSIVDAGHWIVIPGKKHVAFRKNSTAWHKHIAFEIINIGYSATCFSKTYVQKYHLDNLQCSL